MVHFQATDMVASNSPGGPSISFVVKGMPTVQDRTGVSWKTQTRARVYDPSSKNKSNFAKAVKLEMGAVGVTVLPYFTDSTALLLKAKFVLPRPKNELDRRKTPPELAVGAMSFPRGKDLDNLVKFAMDALQGILYANNTNIICAEIQKCYACDILEGVGWTELDFAKVVCIDPPRN